MSAMIFFPWGGLAGIVCAGSELPLLFLFCYHRFTRGDFHVRSNIANKDAPLVAGVTLLILQGVAEAVSAPLGAGDREAVVGG